MFGFTKKIFDSKKATVKKAATVVAKKITGEDIMARIESGEYTPDSEVQEMVFAHSLSTLFVGQVGKDKYTAFKAVNEIVENKSDNVICCSLENEMISDFGVFVKGKVVAAFKKDISSVRSGDKRTILDAMAEKAAVVLHKSEFLTENDTWAEVWVIPTEIVGYWGSKHAVYRNYDTTEEIPKGDEAYYKGTINGLPVKVVEDDQIIRNQKDVKASLTAHFGNVNLSARDMELLKA